MTENNLPNQSAEDEIDLRELFSAIWQGKWIVIVTTLIFAVAGVFYALSLPNIYKSDVLLAPVAQDSGFNLPSQLGGLAAFAGVNLDSNSGVNKVALALEIVQSRDFITKFIKRHNILADLMAVEKWDKTNNIIYYNPDLFNSETGVWVREVKKPKSPEPSMQEAFKEFAGLLNIVQVQPSGMINMSIEHQSPHVSKQWLEWLVIDINAEMKNRDIEEAEQSIAYLQQQIATHDVTDLRAILYSLIEEQTKTLMLANIRDEYSFKTVDNAIAPEEKSSPKRAVIVVLITFVGGFLATVFVLISNIFFKNRKEVEYV